MISPSQYLLAFRRHLAALDKKLPCGVEVHINNWILKYFDDWSPGWTTMQEVSMFRDNAESDTTMFSFEASEFLRNGPKVVPVELRNVWFVYPQTYGRWLAESSEASDG